MPWCRSAPPAAWAWWPSSSAERARPCISKGGLRAALLFPGPCLLRCGHHPGSGARPAVQGNVAAGGDGRRSGGGYGVGDDDAAGRSCLPGGRREVHRTDRGAGYRVGAFPGRTVVRPARSGRWWSARATACSSTDAISVPERSRGWRPAWKVRHTRPCARRRPVTGAGLVAAPYGQPEAVLAGVLHQASWPAQGEQYPRYVAAAAAAWQARCRDDAGQQARDERWLYRQRMLGERERRLSRFEAATARSTRLQPWVDTIVSAGNGPGAPAIRSRRSGNSCSSLLPVMLPGSWP